MANNESDLMQVQLGTETTFSTAVTPAEKLMGVEEAEIQANVETSAVPEERASLVPAFTAVIDSVSGEGSFKGAVNTRQIAYVMDSMFGTATPSGSDPYTRAYAAPLSTKPTPKMFTFMRGSALAAKKLVSAIANEFNITAETNKILNYEASLIGHSVADGTLASLSDLVVNYLHSNTGALKLDTWGGTMGATAIPCTAYKYELGFNANRMLQKGIGSVNPVSHKIKKGEPDSNQLKLSLELDSNSSGWYNEIIQATVGPFKAQIQATFSVGADSWVLQYAGYAAEAPKWVEDEDGVATLEFTFSPLYHTSFGNWFKSSLINAVSTLP